MGGTASCGYEGPEGRYGVCPGDVLLTVAWSAASILTDPVEARRPAAWHDSGECGYVQPSAVTPATRIATNSATGTADEIRAAFRSTRDQLAAFAAARLRTGDRDRQPSCV